jgi:hypothetical protein
MSTYKCISDFGKGAANAPVNNPLSYCLSNTLDSEFNHGAIGKTISGANNKNCQAFMAQYCANDWNDVCEFASKNRSTLYTHKLQDCGSYIDAEFKPLTKGEILIQNTATRKYIVEMEGSQCNIKFEPFDPTVAASPLVSFWSNGCNNQGTGGCIPIYAVDPTKIDKDPVMNKILDKPIIAWRVLINIYNTAKRKGTLNGLKGTRIYKFFMSEPFQKYIKEMGKMHYIQRKGCGCN